MASLRIRLPIDLLDDHFDSDEYLLQAPLDYVSVGDSGSALDATPTVGQGTLPRIPAASQLEILLPAGAVRIARVKLPRVRGHALKRVLPNLVEDNVVGDTADIQFAVLGDTGADGLREVAIVSRAWMNRAVRIIKLRRPRRATVYSEAQLVPRLPFLVVNPDGGYLRHAAGVLPWSATSDGSAPAELRLAQRLLPPDQPLEAGGLAPDRAKAWSQAFGVPLVSTPWTWQGAASPAAADSLLQFDYAGDLSGDGGRLREWRWPLIMAAACLLVVIGGFNLRWWQLGREQSALRERIRSDFTTAFPTVPLNASPVLLAQRELAKVSGVSDDPFFMLTTALAQAVEPGDGKAAVRSLEYRAGVLRARLAPGTDAQAVASRIAQGGVDATVETHGGDAAPVVVVRRRLQS
ncbi:type II secretion system protein GspL [soil metagenome]